MIYMKEKRSLIKKLIQTESATPPRLQVSHRRQIDHLKAVSLSCFQPTHQLVLNMAQPANYKLCLQECKIDPVLSSPMPFASFRPHSPSSFTGVRRPTYLL